MPDENAALHSMTAQPWFRVIPISFLVGGFDEGANRDFARFAKRTDRVKGKTETNSLNPGQDLPKDAATG